MVVTDCQDTCTTIILQPNRSASWLQTKWFITLLSATSLMVGGLWLIAGVWVILPFAGLEAGLASYFIYRVCQNTYQHQVVLCNATTIDIRTGPRGPQRVFTLQRSDTTATLTRAFGTSRRSQLRLQDANHDVTIGDFLTDQDKQDVLNALKRMGLRCKITHPHSQLI